MNMLPPSPTSSDWHPWPVIAARVTYYDRHDLKARRWAFFEVVERQWNGSARWPLTKWAYRGTKRLRWHTCAFRLVCLAALVAAIWGTS